MLRPNPAGKKGYDWTDPSDDEKGQQKTEEKQQKQEKQKKQVNDFMMWVSPAAQPGKIRDRQWQKWWFSLQLLVWLEVPQEHHTI